MAGVLQAAALPAHTIKTIAGDGVPAYEGDNGLAIAAGLASPTHAAVDSKGNVYIADRDNHRIRKVSTDGVITTVAGNGAASFSGDGGQATRAGLDSPFDVAIDADSTLYIADTGNHRIRKIAPNGVITTVAGNGTGAFGGDGGLATAARLNLPADVEALADGTLYIADTLNHRIRKISPNGVITTVAGNGIARYNGDNQPATEAGLSAPSAVAHADGHLYIADTGHYRVRQVAPNGVIRTIAGNGSKGVAAEGGLATDAELDDVYGVAVDDAGNVYLADAIHHRIRKIGLDGRIGTVAGKGVAANSGDGGLATEAGLRSPHGVTVDAEGNLYISDTGNHRVRKVGAAMAHVELVSSPVGPLTYGEPVSLAVLVEGNLPQLPTGAVSFVDLGEEGATAADLCNLVSLEGEDGLGASTALCEARRLAVGRHTLVAAYSGDDTYPSASGEWVQEIVKAPTSTRLARPTHSSADGDLVTLTATVTGQDPSGSVAFKDEAATLSSCVDVALSQGQASCILNRERMDNGTFTATYSGDANNAGSVSPPWSLSADTAPAGDAGHGKGVGTEQAGAAGSGDADLRSPKEPSAIAGTKSLQAFLSYPIPYDSNASLDPWVEIYFKTSAMNKGSVKPVVYLSSDTNKVNLLKDFPNWSTVVDATAVNSTNTTPITYEVFRQNIKTLSELTEYTVSLSSASDAAGNTLVKPIRATFTTRAASNAAVKVTQVSPFDGQMNVWPGNGAAGATPLRITLNMPATWGPYYWHVYKTWDAAKGWLSDIAPMPVSNNNQTASISLTSPLEAGTSYTLEFHCDYRVMQVSGATCPQEFYTYRFSTQPTSLTTIPTVAAAYPNSESEYGIGGSTPIKLWFDLPMDPLSVERAFSLKNQSGTSVLVAAVWSADGKEVSFIPNNPMAANTYSYTLSTGARAEGPSGGYLAADYKQTFQVSGGTGGELLVTSTSPANQANSVSVGSPLVLTFNQAVTYDSVVAALKVSPALSGATISLSSDSKVATVKHSTPLKGNALYTVTLDRTLQSTGSVNLATPYTFNFYTAATSYPTVTYVYPANGATDVDPEEGLISLGFSEPMNRATVEAATQLFAGTTLLCSKVVWGSDTGLMLTPLVRDSNGACSTNIGALAPGTAYTIKVSITAQSKIGVNMAEEFNSSFTTASISTVPDLSLSVTRTFPYNGSGIIGVNTDIFVEFNNPRSASLTSAGFTLGAGGVLIPGAISWSDYHSETGETNALLRFTPSQALAKSTFYTATVSWKDASGKGVSHTFSFTTASITSAEEPAPVVVDGAPKPQSQLVVTADLSSFSVEFDKAMYATSAMYEASIEPALPDFKVAGSGTTLTLSWSANTPLLKGTTYNLRLGKSIQSSGGLNITPVNYPFTVADVGEMAPDVVSLTYSDTTSKPLITLTFTEAMDAVSVQSAFSLSTLGEDGVRQYIPVSYVWPNSHTAQITPTQALTTYITYDAVVSGMAKSSAGVNLVSAYEKEVRVEDQMYIDYMVLGYEDTEIPLNQDIALVFSSAPKTSSVVNGSSFKLHPEGKPTEWVAGSFLFDSGDYEKPNLVFVPDQDLQDSTRYILSLSADTPITDNEGRVLAPLEFPFTTVMRPRVIDVSPVDGAGVVQLSEVIRLQFNTLVDHASAEAAFRLMVSNGGTVAGTFSWFDNEIEAVSELTFSPSTPLAAKTAYNLIITRVMNRAKTLSSTSSFASSFTTAQDGWSLEYIDAAIQAVDAVYNQMVSGGIAWQDGLDQIIELTDVNGQRYVGEVFSDDGISVTTTLMNGDPFDLMGRPQSSSSDAPAKQGADYRNPSYAQGSSNKAEEINKTEEVSSYYNKSESKVVAAKVTKKSLATDQAPALVFDGAYKLTNPKALLLTANEAFDQSTDSGEDLADDFTKILTANDISVDTKILSVDNLYSLRFNTAIKNSVGVLLITGHGGVRENGDHSITLEDEYTLEKAYLYQETYGDFHLYFKKGTITDTSGKTPKTIERFVLNQAGIAKFLAPLLHERAIVFLFECYGGVEKSLIRSKPNVTVLGTAGYNWAIDDSRAWEPAVKLTERETGKGGGTGTVPGTGGLFRVILNTLLGAPLVSKEDEESQNVVSKYVNINLKGTGNPWSRGVRPYTLNTIRKFIDSATWSNVTCQKSNGLCAKSGRLLINAYDPKGGRTLLKPSLALATVEKEQGGSKSTFSYLYGHFGTLNVASVKVYWNDANLDIIDPYLWTAGPTGSSQSWSEYEESNSTHPYDRLRVKLPSGACGGELKVVVDGLSSNAYPITCHSGSASAIYTSTQIKPTVEGNTVSGSHKYYFDCKKIFLHGSMLTLRDNIDDPQKAVIVSSDYVYDRSVNIQEALLPADGSFCDYKFEGVVTETATAITSYDPIYTASYTTTSTLSGSGQVPVVVDRHVQQPAAIFNAQYTVSTDSSKQKIVAVQDPFIADEEEKMNGKLTKKFSVIYQDPDIEDIVDDVMSSDYYAPRGLPGVKYDSDKLPKLFTDYKALPIGVVSRSIKLAGADVVEDWNTDVELKIGNLTATEFVPNELTAR